MRCGNPWKGRKISMTLVQKQSANTQLPIGMRLLESPAADAHLTCLARLAEAHQIGAKTIFLCCVSPADSLPTFVDVFIAPIVGPEIIAGSTRMKAGTATKLVLNMLTTISMIMVGKVYSNLMVDVQASNAKMIDRGTRIVMEVVGTNYETAQAALEHADGSAKVAIVMLAKGVNQEEAVARLERHRGFLRQVLEEPNTSSNL